MSWRDNGRNLRFLLTSVLTPRCTQMQEDDIVYIYIYTCIYDVLRSVDTAADPLASANPYVEDA